MRDPSPNTESFLTTRWTRVLAAKGDSEVGKAALSDLCDAYYAPVHAFIRSTVRDVPPDQTRDLTHEFFAALLLQPRLDSLERGRGKFRSYLLGAVKHFLMDRRKKQSAAKRGADQVHESIDETDKNSDPISLPSSDATYDREWALAVIARGIDILENEHEAAGKIDQFQQLKPWLGGNANNHSQADAARKLGISEGAVKVAVHRLRKQFRQIIRSEIAQTVTNEEEITAELNYLIEALTLKRGESPT